jgi:hypothetical protein
VWLGLPHIPAWMGTRERYANFSAEISWKVAILNIEESGVRSREAGKWIKVVSSFIIANFSISIFNSSAFIHREYANCVLDTLLKMAIGTENLSTPRDRQCCVHAEGHAGKSNLINGHYL